MDFTATAHFFHLLFCCVYAGFPVSWLWWSLNLGCMVLMAVIGEYVCMRTELRAIPVTIMSVKSSVWQPSKLCWFEANENVLAFFAKRASRLQWGMTCMGSELDLMKVSTGENVFLLKSMIQCMEIKLLRCIIQTFSFYPSETVTSESWSMRIMGNLIVFLLNSISVQSR